jgi:hypothetical protein
MMQRAWEQALSYLMEHDPDAAREAYAELLDLRGCHEVAAWCALTHCWRAPFVR